MQLDTVAYLCMMAMGVNEGETEGKPTRHPAGEGVANTALYAPYKTGLPNGVEPVPFGDSETELGSGLQSTRKSDERRTNRLAGYSHQTYEAWSNFSRPSPQDLASLPGLRQALQRDSNGDLLLECVQAEGQIPAR